jgi:hypothetical protein
MTAIANPVAALLPQTRLPAGSLQDRGAVADRTSSRGVGRNRHDQPA